MGEEAGAATLRRAGYELLATKLPRNQGFDHVGVLKNPDGSVKQICIVESKYSQTGDFRLGNGSKERQMSQEWISATILQMERSGDPQLIETARIMSNNPDKWVLRGHVLDADGVNRWRGATEKVQRYRYNR